MSIKERRLKICEAPGQRRDVPRINLQGDWLSNLGFRIGDHVIVSYQQGKLVIELDPIIDPKTNS